MIFDQLSFRKPQSIKIARFIQSFISTPLTTRQLPTDSDNDSLTVLQLLVLTVRA